MSHKETDLQKVISEVKASLEDKELQKLADDVLSKVESNGNNLSAILNNPSLQSTLLGFLQNRNLADLLNNPNLSSQIANFLNTPGSSVIVDQLKSTLNQIDTEKKKISDEDESAKLKEKLKEALLSRYSQKKYEKQREIIQTLTQLTAPSKQKSLESLYNLFLLKEIVEGIKISDNTIPNEITDD